MPSALKSLGIFFTYFNWLCWGINDCKLVESLCQKARRCELMLMLAGILFDLHYLQGPWSMQISSNLSALKEITVSHAYKRIFTCKRNSLCRHNSQAGIAFRYITYRFISYQAREDHLNLIRLNAVHGILWTNFLLSCDRYRFKKKVTFKFFILLHTFRMKVWSSELNSATSAYLLLVAFLNLQRSINYVMKST